MSPMNPVNPTNQNDSLLNTITCPDDIKPLSSEELIRLAGEIRRFLIESVSKTGGHIGANLGVIELTIALHYSFNLPDDALLFDVGHQGYTHKLLTGRKHLFPTLNTPGGMSRFITSKESSYDLLEASHAGTAISIGTGIAMSYKLDKRDAVVVSMVGDGSLVEGMSFEGLNFAVETSLPLVIVINDNGMSIPKNVGGIKNLFSGSDWQEKSGNYFRGLGFEYISVPDGHDLPSLIAAMQSARKLAAKGAVVVHAKTEKGRGLELAKTHPYKMHFSMPFDPGTGDGCSPVPAGESYAKIAGDTLYELVKNDRDIVVLTPATPYASGVEKCLQDFPENVIDVGMAEQHAAGMAAGLAMRGKKVFLCYQSTFMQRAMDQLFHDVAAMNLPVTIVSARSGFAGFDSSTHHAIYDISYLRGLPNLDLFYAGTGPDVQGILQQRARHAEGPLIVLHPYEAVPASESEYFSYPAQDLEKPSIVMDGDDGFILTVGNRFPAAVALRELLAERGRNFGIVNIRWLNPLPEDFLLTLADKVGDFITLEENVEKGGFGSAVATLLATKHPKTRLFISAVKQDFVDVGDKDDLSLSSSIDARSVFAAVSRQWEI